MKGFSKLMILGLLTISYSCTDCQGCLDKDIAPECGTDGVTYLN